MIVKNIKFGDKNITDVYFGNIKINLFDSSTEEPEEPVTPSVIFNYEDYLNIHENYDYKPSGTYYGMYIPVTAGAWYTVKVDAGEAVGAVFINNISAAYSGAAYVDLRKTTSLSKVYQADENGRLYLVCGTGVPTETYNNVISTRNIRITKN